MQGVDTKKSYEKTLADSFLSLYRTIGSLLHPETGCPWDLKQTHESLKKYLLEECYEVFDAIDAGEDRELCEELGDILLQVLLHAGISQKRGGFDMQSLIAGLDAKMQRRHPHVFAKGAESYDTSDEGLQKTWEAIKAAEGKKATVDSMNKVLSQALPASLQAQELGKLSHQFGFDWRDSREALAAVKREIAEFEEALENEDADGMEDELGDISFGLAQLVRKIGLNAELVTRKGNEKFVKRCASMRQLAHAEGWYLEQYSRDQLGELWKKAKQIGGE